MTSHQQLRDPKQRLGWIPDLPDARDYRYSVSRALRDSIPPKIDLRKDCPPVYNQGNLGSCTANAIGGAFEFELKKQGLSDFMPSRLFIYYNERTIEHSVASDSGAALRDGIKTLAKEGVCTELTWPYDAAKFSRKPAAKCYTEGRQHTITAYQRLTPVLTDLKACIAEGYPFVFGFSVYDSFMSDKVAQTGHMPMPNLAKEHLQGGHAVMAVGYDDIKKWFIIRNSWGDTWGIRGYFTMPYDFITDAALCDDFWTIRTIHGS